MPKWQGLMNPARLLTLDEITTFEKLCAVCSNPAFIVEAQRILTAQEREQTIDTFEPDDLRFTCGLHGPIEVPEVLFDRDDLALYEAMREWCICPTSQCRKHYVTCLTFQPSCLSNCAEVLTVIPDDLTVETVKHALKRGERLYKERAQQKEEAHGNDPLKKEEEGS